MIIQIDTREQAPWAFPEHIETCRGKLDAGDYAIQGDEGFGIERKSLPDFVSTVVKERARFERELDRMAAAGWPARIIVVEATIHEVFRHEYPNQKVSPAFILSIISGFAMRNIQVIWAGDPLGGAAYCLGILKKREEALELEKELAEL